MPIVLKSVEDIERMRRSGEVVADVHRQVRAAAEPGVTTAELDELAYQVITSAGGHPSFLNYRGFPASLCVSVNEELLHGIPGRRKLQVGDLLSIDVGVYLDGFHADAAVTFGIGEISDGAQRLIEVTEQCFWTGFPLLQPGNRLGDAAVALTEFATSQGYGVVREYAGHGIGRKMHEDPSVPNIGVRGKGTLLRPGMTIAYEPMITAGNPQTRVLEDGWTVVTVDGSLSAHFEHTVVITAEGPEILTHPARVVV